MTDENKDLDLETLWQSEKGQIDMDMIMEHVQHGDRLGARFRAILYGFYALSLALAGFLEWSGVYGTGGLLSVGLFMVYALGVFRMYRSRPDFATLAPLEQLRHCLRRAKNNLLIARMLAVYMPIVFIGGVGIGYVAGKVMGPSASESLSSGGALLLIGVTLSGLSAIAVFGSRLAQKLRLEITALEDRIKLFEGDV
ncbi:MAG: hypothetical protein ABJG15_05910 [Hyphomonadaceae bacterium]